MARSFTAAANARVTYPRLFALDGARQCAVSCWVSRNATQLDYPVIIGHWQFTPSPAGFAVFQRGTSGGDLHVVAHGATGGYHDYLSALTSAAWTHILAQYDGAQATAANRVRVYVGGTLLTPSASSGTLPTTLATVPQPFAIGWGQDENYWSGSLARCAVWGNTVLSPGDREQLAAGAAPWTVHPQALVWADDLRQYATPRNVVSGEPGTVTATASVADPTDLLPEVPSRFSQRVQPAWWLNATKVTEGA
jgi:hypothetical protein